MHYPPSGPAPSGPAASAPAASTPAASTPAQAVRRRAVRCQGRSACNREAATSVSGAWGQSHGIGGGGSAPPQRAAPPPGHRLPRAPAPHRAASPAAALRLDPTARAAVATFHLHAAVAKLVDAHGSGPCGGNPLEVQVLSAASGSGSGRGYLTRLITISYESVSTMLRPLPSEPPGDSGPEVRPSVPPLSSIT